MRRVLAVLVVIVLIEALFVAFVGATSGLVEGVMVGVALLIVTGFGSAPLVLRALSHRR